MGQHTWFYKSKEKNDYLISLYNILDGYEIGDNNISEEEYNRISELVDELESDEDYKDISELHDYFRSSKRCPNGGYLNVELSSFEEFLKFVETNEIHITYKDVWGEFSANKQCCISKVKHFFEEYPNGVIEVD